MNTLCDRESAESVYLASAATRRPADPGCAAPPQVATVILFHDADDPARILFVDDKIDMLAADTAPMKTRRYVNVKNKNSPSQPGYEEFAMNPQSWIAIFSLLLVGLFACTMPPAEHAQHAHSAAAGEEPERITIEQVLTRMAHGEPIVFLDSRNTTAWSEGSIKISEAIRVGNNQQLAEIMQKLPRDSFIVTYCT